MLALYDTNLAVVLAHTFKKRLVEFLQSPWHPNNAYHLRVNFAGTALSHIQEVTNAAHKSPLDWLSYSRRSRSGAMQDRNNSTGHRSASVLQVTWGLDPTLPPMYVVPYHRKPHCLKNNFEMCLDHIIKFTLRRANLTFTMLDFVYVCVLQFFVFIYFYFVCVDSRWRCSRRVFVSTLHWILWLKVSCVCLSKVFKICMTASMCM